MERRLWRRMVANAQLSIFFLFLLGCASTDNYRVAVNSWKGEKIQALIARWGYPNQVLKLVNGHSLYIYQFEDRGEIPPMTMPGFTTVQVSHGATTVSSIPAIFNGGTFYELKCTTWFEVDKTHHIIGMSFRGNNCVSSQKAAQRLAHP